MKKKKNNRIKILLLILLCLSVGYALITTVLKINGSARFAQQSWNVYWANPQVTEGSKSMVKPTVVDDGANSRNAKTTWNVTFDLPGEYYEFTIDAVNAGSINAIITGVDFTVTPELSDYISYKVTYANGKSVKAGQVLAAASDGVPTVVTYKIRIEYLLDEVDASVINDMDDDLSLTYNFGITYGRNDSLAMKDVPLSQEELEEFVALVESNPDLYRNKKQNPLNRDMGIDAYGNVINLDNFRTTPSLFVGACKSYDYDTVGGQCDGQTQGGLSWATASEFFEDGEWTLTFPAYLMIYDEENPDEPGHFSPVREIDAFFSGYYSERTDDKKLEKLPLIPYTVTELDGTFENIGSLDGPITIPSQITNIGWLTFNGAFKGNTDRTVRLPISYEGSTYWDGVDNIEYYD